jgi:hypothetical protein
LLVAVEGVSKSGLSLLDIEAVFLVALVLVDHDLDGGEHKEDTERDEAENKTKGGCFAKPNLGLANLSEVEGSGFNNGLQVTALEQQFAFRSVRGHCEAAGEGSQDVGLGHHN